jgi:hypothetical protein
MMMKKILVLMLVLGMASLANATVIDLVVVGTGSLGHAGTTTDPLVSGETISLKIVLDHNRQWPSSPSYDGYGLSSMDLSLDVGSAGTLLVDTLKGTEGDAKLTWNGDFTATAVNDESLPSIPGNQTDYDVGSDIDQIMAVGSPPAGPGVVDLVSGITLLAGTSAGTFVLDLALNGQTQYSVDLLADGSDTYSGWVNAVEADLGNGSISVIPEPATVALLGLGGLLLMRRRR